jgi:hypothetical protein
MLPLLLEQPTTSPAKAVANAPHAARRVSNFNDASAVLSVAIQ